MPRLATFRVLGGWLHCWTRPQRSLTEVRGKRQGLCIYCLFVKHPRTHRVGPPAARPRPPPLSGKASFVLSGQKYTHEGRRWASAQGPVRIERVGGEAGSIGWERRHMWGGVMQVRNSTGSHNEAQKMSPGDCCYKGRATLACRYKITTRGIQPQHSLVITPHPSNPASVTCPLPPGHLSQKRLTHRHSLSRENASTAPITGAKRDDGGGHHDDGPTTVLVAPLSGRPHAGGLPDRAPGSLVKDPESKRQDAHTTGVGGKYKPQTRHSVERLNVYLPPSGGSGTALLSRSDIPTGPFPSTLRGALASGQKTGVKRGPHPPPGVCPRPNQNMPTKSPRRG